MGDFFFTQDTIQMRCKTESCLSHTSINTSLMFCFRLTSQATEEDKW